MRVKRARPPLSIIKMKRHLLAALLVFSALCLSCKKDNPVEQGPEIELPADFVCPDPASGITVEPKLPDADGACTIYFKPTATSSVSSSLYNCTSDIYVHIGVYHDDEWKYVPAQWNQNISKCKMEKVGENSYKLEVGPSIREYFASGTTPVSRIAMVMRSADGTKQTKPDQFNSVTDNKYKDGEFTPAKVVEAPMPEGVREGINYNSDGSVTLVLADKASDGSHYDYSYVIGEFSKWKRVDEYAMKRDSDKGCWWYTMTGVQADKEYMYQYYVGNSAESFRIHDPYTEIVYDPWNDKYISTSTYPDMPAYPEETKGLVGAFKVARDGYSWKTPDFKIQDENNLVIYEMHLRDFSATHDINGAMEHLDYIQNLGVNAIELMPVQEFDGNDSWGYNPCSYFALDKAYGTRKMYKDFIDECHSRGIAVIFDVVYNHVTGSHPMARLYWNSTDNNVSSINPWFNVVTPHGFGVYHDWNHINKQTVEHVKRSLEYLLNEYHIDGFRFDLTKGFTNNSGKDSSFDQQRVDILKGYGSYIKSINPDAVVILEHFVDAENYVLHEAGMHVWGNNNYNYSQIVKGANADLSYIFDSTNTRVGYMESHDEERLCVSTTAGSSTSVKWGLVGTMNNWGTTPDIALAQDQEFFSAKNVTFTASDEFKIRGNGSWDDKYNYGAAAAGTKLTLGAPYILTLGSSSQNMKAPAAGTYDVFFSATKGCVWLMTPGERPQGGDTDAVGLKLRRAGLAAAFFLTVPGPKMIWQFGELGYDYSIDYNDRTGAKPIKWEYYYDAQRRELYNTYAGLLRFRNENPEFFSRGAEFKAQVSNSYFADGKFLFGEAAGKHFCVMGNFDSTEKEITANLPVEATWTNYFDSSESQKTSSYTVKLKPGEFRLLVDFK